MARKPFRGATGKTVWENMNFGKGIKHNNEPQVEGQIKTIANLDISKTGGTSGPRKPYFSNPFRFEEDEVPVTLDNDTMLFKSIQDTSKEYFLSIGGTRKDKKYKVIPINTIEDVTFRDGDSFVVNGIEYRLLGLDAAEYRDEEGNVTIAGAQALNRLRDLIQFYITESAGFYAVYDKGIDSDIDAFDRHLIWLYADQSNLNIQLLEESVEQGSFNGHYTIMGGFGEGDVVIPSFMAHSEFTFEPDWEALKSAAETFNESVSMSGPLDAQKSVMVYHKPSQTVLKPYQPTQEHITTNYIDLDVTPGLLSTIGIYSDLDIPVGHPFGVRLRKETYLSDKELHNYFTEYRPWVRVEDIDGIAFMGEVYYNDEVFYSGLMSLSYFIPLDGNKPQFDRGYFKLDTYQNKAFQIKFEELNNRYNLNLLDPNVPGRRDFRGEDVREFNYFTYSIPTIGVLNQRGEFVTQMQADHFYKFRPYYVLPEIDENEPHDLYVTKFEFFKEAEDMTLFTFRAYANVGEFPSEGEENVIYVAVEDSFKNYRWINGAYSEYTISPAVASTGFRPAFDRQGNPIDISNKDEFFTYRKYVDEGGPYEPLREQIVISDTVLQDQNILSTTLHEQLFTQSGIYNVYRFNLMTDTDRDFVDIYLSPKGFYSTTPITLEATQDDISYVTVELNPRVVFYNDVGDVVREIPLVSFLDGMNKFKIPLESFDHRIQIRDVHVLQGGNFVNTNNWYQFGKNTPADAHNSVIGLDGFIVRGDLLQNSAVFADTNDAIFKDNLSEFRGEVYMKVTLSRVTIEAGEFKESDFELDFMGRVNTVQISIRNNEVLETAYQHGQDLHACRGITFYEGHVVLYDSPKAPNVIYMSDAGGNLTYFPFRRALDQFASNIVHVEPVKQGLMVFTTSDIYLAYEVVDENEQVFFQADIVYSNLSIAPHHRNTVRGVGRDVIFMAENSVVTLRPNPYVNDVRDMFLQDLSRDIQDILENPTPYITRRLMFYGTSGDIFTVDWKPTIEYYAVVRNEKVHFYMSIDLPIDQPMMFVLNYDREYRRWTTYDTRACSFPVHHALFDPNEGVHMLMRNDRTIQRGTTLVLNEGLNLWDFDDGFGRYFDTKPLKIVDGEFIYATALKEEDFNHIKQPIHIYINTGFMNTNPHLNKRFYKSYLELRNIDAIEVPMTIEFNVDGRVRQTSNELRINHIQDPASPNYGQITDEFVQVYDFEPFAIAANTFMEGGTSFQTWQISMHRFGPLNKLRINFGISGRGRNPNLEFALKVTGKLEIYGFGVVYKEQANQ